MKWFNNPKTIEEVKQQYKRLALAHHPDVGGDNESMKEINAEYDVLFAKLKDVHQAADGNVYTAKAATTETANQFKDIIDKLIHMDNINIEICGSWVWVSGKTYRHKDKLKHIGFKFSKQKAAWYYHSDGYRKHNSKTYTLDEIRDLFGSETVIKESLLSLKAV